MIIVSRVTSGQSTSYFDTINVKLIYHPDRYSYETHKKININYLGDSIYLKCYYRDVEITNVNYNISVFIKGFIGQFSKLENEYISLNKLYSSANSIQLNDLLFIDINWVIIQDSDTIYFPTISNRPSINSLIKVKGNDLNQILDFHNTMRWWDVYDDDYSKYIGNLYYQMKEDYFGLVFFFCKW